MRSTGEGWDQGQGDTQAGGSPPGEGREWDRSEFGYELGFVLGVGFRVEGWG